MVKVGITIVFKEPVQIDQLSNIVSKEDSFGFKVTNNIDYPKFTLINDKLSSNIS